MGHVMTLWVRIGAIISKKQVSFIAQAWLSASTENDPAVVDLHWTVLGWTYLAPLDFAWSQEESCTEWIIDCEMERHHNWIRLKLNDCHTNVSSFNLGQYLFLQRVVRSCSSSKLRHSSSPSLYLHLRSLSPWSSSSSVSCFSLMRKRN